MDVNFTKAAQAYQNKPKPEKAGGLGDNAAGKSNFSDMVKSAGKEAVNSISAGEKASMQAVAGEAELTDVVSAVTQAEITLQTVVNIRDTLVESYRRVMQMPI